MSVDRQHTSAAGLPPRRKPVAGWLDQAAFAAMALLAFGFAFEWIRPVFVLGGISLTSTELLVLAAVGLWLAARLAGWQAPQTPQGVALPALLWLVALVASSLLAPDHRADALKFTARTATGLTVGWAAYDIVTASPVGSRRWKVLLRLLASAGVAVTVFGLAEAVQWEPALRWLEGFKKAPTSVGDLLRVSSTLGYATVAAMVLELTLPLLLAWLMTARRGWQQAVLAFALIAQTTALVLTLTRGGMIALAAGLLVLAALAWRRRLRGAVVGGLAAAVLLAALVGVLLAVNPLASLRFKSESEAGWYQAAYRAPLQVDAQAGAWLEVPVEVANAGVRAWDNGGAQPVAQSNNNPRPGGEMVAFDGVRTQFSQRVAPGDQVSLDAQVHAPAVPGSYVLEWDMVHEGVTWFSAKGAASARTRLTVASAAGAAAAPAAEAGKASVAWQTPPAGRLQLWRTALRMVLARPLLGVGPDVFRLVYGDYADIAAWNTAVHANNLYLEWLADTGLIGFVLFLWLNSALVLSAYRTLSRGEVSAVQDIYRLALLAALTVWYVHGLLDSFYEFTPTFVAFWVIAGLACARLRPLSSSDSRDYAIGI